MVEVEEILKRKRETIERLKQRRSIKDAILATKKAGKKPIIAEVKRRGLKEGEKEVEIEAAKAASQMEKAGACAISVLTDEAFFGSLEDLKTVKLSVDLPVLRKDFIFDEFQVYESYAYGANAILLIARFLSAARLNELAKMASSLGMESVIEIDSESKDKIFDADLDLTGISSSSLIGINNRDLNTFEVNLETFEKISLVVKPELPADVPLVAMSGIDSKEDARRMFDAGADALLVGTSIMNAEDIERKVKDFVDLEK
uniref:indole-3-glycerol-phosphate synthase n=1 Tax=Candidatus Methanophagaceae archaeon ANME-1 ERB6 TaxID=2759912 RepID=A0A7G9YXM9_9EURY|nr:indole-3-glycerol phosphate synthase [Methanosarcinales archaeon ANME-1 ERB6]